MIAEMRAALVKARILDIQRSVSMQLRCSLRCVCKVKAQYVMFVQKSEVLLRTATFEVCFSRRQQGMCLKSNRTQEASTVASQKSTVAD